MNAPLSAPLFCRRRNGAARPDPRRHRGLQRRPESAQGQPRRRRLLRRQRQGAAARVRAPRRARDDRKRRAARLSADRRHRRPTTARCRRCCSAPTATSSRAGRVVTVQALGGTGGAQGRRRFPAPLRARRASLDQRSELGEPSRAVRRRRLHRQHLSLLRRGDARPRFRRHDRRRCEAVPRRDRSSCCTPAATTRPASIRRPSSGAASSRSCARAGCVPFLDLAYQGFADGIDADGAVVRRFAATPGPLFVSSSFSKSFSLYGERVGALSIVAADRDEAARVLSQLKRVIRAQLLEPADARRPDRRHGAATRPSCARCGSRSSATMRERIRADAPRAGRAACARARRAPTSDFVLRAARHVLVLRPDQGAGRAAARANSRSTRSTPGASASPRSIRATSTTWPTRSPRSSRRRDGRCAILTVDRRFAL